MTSSTRFFAGTLLCAALAQLQLMANAQAVPDHPPGFVSLTPSAVSPLAARHLLLADATAGAALDPPSAQASESDPNSTNVETNLRGPINTGSQTQSPNPTAAAVVTPPQIGPYESNTAGQSTPSLTGLANITSVTATGTPLLHIPFDRLRDPDLQFVQISLRNDSQQVAVINGDASQASLGSAVEPAVGGGYITQTGKPGLTRKKHIEATAATLGSAGLAGPLLYEYITPGQHRDRSLGEAIGVDGTRHRVEAQRFGVRVLMPGDETIGWMAFACEEGQSVQAVTIPLSFSRSLTPDGVLEVPIRLSAIGAAASLQPPNTRANQRAAAAALKDAQQDAVKSGAPKRTAGEASMLQDPTMTSTSSQPEVTNLTAPSTPSAQPPVTIPLTSP
jgi:hypothetical protein